MPTLRSCACITWNEISRDWLPAVEWKSNESLPTPGHE